MAFLRVSPCSIIFGQLGQTINPEPATAILASTRKLGTSPKPNSAFFYAADEVTTDMFNALCQDI
jgi:hypothetical protein